ncbi:hypothetical protein [Rhodomicrobium sp.]|uniref:hypothetical protein n=1 Tax=Rhodomicrobium sp. TaxID=2720632 RepID=UPI0039E5BA1C
MPKLAAPTQCRLWQITDTIKHDLALLQRVETYSDESHFSRSLLRCSECGQLYFHEFYETIDWEHGNDPQYVTWVPVSTPEEIEALKATTLFSIHDFVPRLLSTWPSDAERPALRWIR